VQSALAPISDLRPFVCAGLLGLSTLVYVLPEGAFFLKTRSLAVPFRPVLGCDALLLGHSKPEHCLSVFPPRSVSVVQSALGRHAVTIRVLPTRVWMSRSVMHQFSNALGEPHRLWYELQLSIGFGSLRADAIRFLASLSLARSYYYPATACSIALPA